MFEFLIQHQLAATAVISWMFSAAVSAMPDPNSSGNPGYLWLFRFMHSVAGNITTAFSEAARYRAGASPGGKIPGLKTIVFLLLIPFLFTTTACAAHYQVHPGALNKTDSAAYDTLLIAQAVIDQARLDYNAGRLPGKTKPALDGLIESYNVARQAWLTYRGAIGTDAPPGTYLDQLTKNVADLTSAIRAFEEAGK